jgi:hypothetical protein
MKTLAPLAFSLILLNACSSSSSTGGTGSGTDSGGGGPGVDSGSADTSTQPQDSSMPADSAIQDSSSTTDSHSSNSDATITDSSPPTNDAEVAHCGQPGDTGNSLGVGKYCASEGDCIGNGSAIFCSNLGGPGTNFCTMSCTASDASNPCGSGASCQCQGGQCGCTPNYCL